MGQELHDFLPAMEPGEAQPGPSWQRPNWPPADLAGEDDLTAALDPLAMELAIKAKSGGKPDAASVEQAAGDSIRAMMLIRTYRVRGHLAAALDPLGLA